MGLHEFIVNTLQLLLAGAIGWLIGYERTMRRKPAGARTFAIICVGCTMMTLAGLKGFASTDTAGRVIANIIVGIGFIGAGVIWKQGGSIQGVTTASLIWVCAGIGMSIGLGLYGLALLAFVITFIFVITHDTVDYSETQYNPLPYGPGTHDYAVPASTRLAKSTKSKKRR